MHVPTRDPEREDERDAVRERRTDVRLDVGRLVGRDLRRLVGDRDWPATTPFAEVAGYFPGPVAALRTLKSDVITGLDPAALADLDTTGQPWRTDGSHALIQVQY